MDCIILSAGVGQRAKLNYPKQLFRLNGKPILIHILELFKQIDKIDNIIITVPQDVDYYTDLIKSYGIDGFTCIIGGGSRQESVYKALQHCTSRRIIIHESARPFINKQHITDLLNSKGNVVVPYTTPTSTVYYDKKRFINRDATYLVQLPQIFNLDKLKRAHELAKENDRYYTDDSSLVYGELNIQPVLIKGLEENIKITTPIDIQISEVLYNEYCNSNRW